MNLPVNLPDSLDLAATIVEMDNQRLTLGDYVDQAFNNQTVPFDARNILTIVSDLLINGETSDMKLISWGLCPTP